MTTLGTQSAINFAGIEDFEGLFECLRQAKWVSLSHRDEASLTMIQVRGLVANAVRKDFARLVNREHREVDLKGAQMYATDVIHAHANDLELLHEREFLAALQRSCRTLFRRGFRQSRGVDLDVQYLTSERAYDELTTKTDDEFLAHLCGQLLIYDPTMSPRSPVEQLIRRRLESISRQYRSLIATETATYGSMLSVPPD